MTGWLALLASLGGALALLLAPHVGLLPLWRRFRSFRERARCEDALKHVVAWQQRDRRASLESLAGGLRIAPAAALRIAQRLESEGWIEFDAAGIGLTPRGERRALEVVRAHRIWERHLSDDANMPIDRLHQAAERAEHSLSVPEVARLDAHLGHPQHDPHGDPIPSADGRVASLEAVSIGDWPVGPAARIAHIEDEPDAVFRQVIESGLRPAQIVRVLSAGSTSLLVECEGKELRIDRAVANNIHVAAAARDDMLPAAAVRLSSLCRGSLGEVVALGSECTGFTRRRLLDLGLTPGATVQVALDNTFGDPRAFRIRGTTIALRRQQADQVWILQRGAGPPGGESRP